MSVLRRARQLGHASIKLTVDSHGRWLPMGKKAAVDGLEDESGSNVVAQTATGTSDHPEVPVTLGGPSRTRTLDPLINLRVTLATATSDTIAQHPQQ